MISYCYSSPTVLSSSMKLHRRYVRAGKHIVCVGFGTTHGVGHPLGVLEPQMMGDKCISFGAP